MTHHRQKMLENPFQNLSRGRTRIGAKFGENQPLERYGNAAWYTGRKTESSEPPPPHFASTSPMAPKISWPVHGMYFFLTELGADPLQFVGVIRERLIFRIPKVITIIYLGWSHLCRLSAYNNNHRVLHLIVWGPHLALSICCWFETGSWGNLWVG